MTQIDLRRPDFSQVLIHLTKKTSCKGSAGQDVVTVSAFTNLKSILTSGKIKGSDNSGYIKGSRKAVCFSEIPLSSIRYFAKREDEDDSYKKYNYYGLAVSKESAFSAGARPVIYLPDA